jgi:hypothetical protein
MGSPSRHPSHNGLGQKRAFSLNNCMPGSCRSASVLRLTYEDSPDRRTHAHIRRKGQLGSKAAVCIRIFAPQPVDPSSVTFTVDAGVASCVVKFDGLPDGARQALGADSTVFGADSIQALHLAVDVDRVLRRLSKHYDFYFGKDRTPRARWTLIPCDRSTAALTTLP